MAEDGAVAMLMGAGNNLLYVCPESGIQSTGWSSKLNGGTQLMFL